MRQSNPTNRNFFELEEEFTSMKKSPAFLEFTHWKQLKDRVLVINDDVADYLIDEIVMPIIQWNKEDEDLGLSVEERTPIKVYINSNGGDVDVCLGIIGAFNASKTPIHTIALGKAYSCGALILINGHKRFAYPTSSILIHEGTTGVMNSSSKTRDYVSFNERINNEVVKKFIINRTKISEELYDKNYRNEWYFLGKDALGLGVIDELID
jgi:ATP-dependent Clp protease protease subunit